MSRNLYKKKGVVGVDSKDKRRLRRSIHQKEVRDHGFLTRRLVDSGSEDLSPVKEPRPAVGTKARPTAGAKSAGVTLADKSSTQVRGTKKVNPRREMLNKWKEEKNMKRKVDQMKNATSKPNFKVFKVNYKQVSYLDDNQEAKKGTSRRAHTTNSSTGKPGLVPPVRRSSRLATKDNPPASRTQRQATSVAGARGKTTRSKPVSVERKPAASQATSVLSQKSNSKKAIPKLKEPLFPTMSSFTFRKEIAVTLKTIPVSKTNMSLKSVKVQGTGEVQTGKRVTRRTAAVANVKMTIPPSVRGTAKSGGQPPKTVMPAKTSTSNQVNKITRRKPETTSKRGQISSDRMTKKMPARGGRSDVREKGKKPSTSSANHSEASVNQKEPESQIEETVSPSNKKAKYDNVLEEDGEKCSSEEVPSESVKQEEEAVCVAMDTADSKDKTVSVNESLVSKEDRDGAEHYQKLMDDERKRLTDLCSSWEDTMKVDDIPEEVTGDIRSAIGKAQLLMNQRFHQFGGLVEQCRLGLGEKRTHTTDLQGFWDMVYFQVEDVDKMFTHLLTLKENNWKQEEKQEHPPVTKKVLKKKAVAKPGKGLSQKKAARERLAAVKAALKEKKNAQEETVVFDAGFFHVESPVKEKEIHCAAGSSVVTSPSKRKSLTPRISSKRPSLAGKEQGLLRAVLQASRTPKMNSMSPLVDGVGIFSPEQGNSSANKNIVTRLQDLGLSSGRKRRRSQNPKSTKTEPVGDKEGVNEAENDLSSYLMATLPVVDLNSQAEEMMKTEPLDQLKDLGKKSLIKEDRRLSGFSPLPTTPTRSPLPRQTSTGEDVTADGKLHASSEMQCKPCKLPKVSEDVDIAEVSDEDREGAVHYQGKMDAERERLTHLCSLWNQVIENEDLTEDAAGDICSSIGKAQLLMNQRFHQFAGLVEQCRLGLGEKKTHTTDLQGFWEMIYFQIEDVDKMFANLSELKENGWVAKETVQPVVKKTIKKQKKVTGKVKTSAADKKAARERLEAAKAALKVKQTRQRSKVVFDAGFFKVESPAKQTEAHCIAGSSLQGSPSLRKSDIPTFSPMLKRSLSNAANRTPIAGKEEDLLRAVLSASHTPKVNRVPSPENAGSIFTPEERKATPLGQEEDMVTRLQDLGLDSIGSSNRKRRRSRRRKSTKEVINMEDVEKENVNDLSSYLLPSLPVVDLNSQAEEMMRTEPVDQLRDLGKRTPLADRNSKSTENDVFMKLPLIPYNPSPVSDLFDSPKPAPRRSVRIRTGRISAFSPPRRSFANVPPSMDLISFD